MANCNTCEIQEKCLKQAPCIVEVFEQVRADERINIMLKGKKFMADENEKCKCVDCFFRWLEKEGAENDNN